MASIVSSLKDMFVKDEQADDEFSDDFIYWWDDIEEAEYVEEERKSLRETLNENLVLLLHLAILLPVIPLLVLVGSIQIYISIISGILIVGIVIISYLLIRNRYITPEKILNDNLEMISESDLTGTEDLLYAKEQYPSLDQFDQFRTDIGQLFQSYESNFDELHNELSLMESMITSVNRDVDQINLNIDNTVGSTANYQETKGYISQVSSGVDDLTENFDDSLNAAEELIRILKSIGKQTTMLALNAGIEAAKAGTHGKGFEVVASNLRRLAQHANNSATRIKNTTDDINYEARGALETITNAMISVNEIVDHSHTQIVELNNDLYSSVRDLNTLQADFSKLVTILEQGEQLLRAYRY